MRIRCPQVAIFGCCFKHPIGFRFDTVKLPLCCKVYVSRSVIANKIVFGTDRHYLCDIVSSNLDFVVKPIFNFK